MGRDCKWPKCLSGLPSFKTNSRWKLFVGVYHAFLAFSGSNVFQNLYWSTYHECIVESKSTLKDAVWDRDGVHMTTR